MNVSKSPYPDTPFKPPPSVECIAQEHCLSVGKKVHADTICAACLKRHDLQKLHAWAKSKPNAMALLKAHFASRHQTKLNIETHGRFLCAFEDPDYEHCRWRRPDLNLRGKRKDCGVVKRKGTACTKCWRRHLRKIAIVQYFTPLGLCHEEADKVVLQRDEASSARGCDDFDDVEGYGTIV